MDSTAVGAMVVWVIVMVTVTTVVTSGFERAVVSKDHGGGTASLRRESFGLVTAVKLTAGNGARGVNLVMSGSC